jgi:tellurite methyltransferase
MTETSDRYNRIYEHRDNVYGEQPDPIVESIPIHIQGGQALELGAGYGRNSIYLAEKGFNVTAIDFSETGIKKLKKQAETKGLKIRASVADATQYDFNTDYDVIVNSFMMQHMNREDGLALIKKFQDHTLPGGLNALLVFTQDSDFYKNELYGDFYPAKDELRKLYKDWEVLSYNEYETKALQTGPDGSAMRNTAASLLCRRKQ